jgi:hypothetical protein
LNVAPDPGVAVNVTVLPLRKPTAQLLPQLRPPTSLVIVPEPVLETVSVIAGANAASTVVSAVIVTVHVPVPEHPPPLQPVKIEFDAAVAVSVTVEPSGRGVDVQVAPQLMPPTLLVTVPVPPPLFVTVRIHDGTNVAVTDVAAFTVTTHVVDDPEQPPPVKPVNTEPAAGAAVSVTCVPAFTVPLQVAPQLIPPTLLVTVPVPVPAGVTVRANVGTNVAVTVVLAFSVTAQVPVPEHPPPLHPVNAEPAAGVAVNVTTVPEL